jgi:protein TonB
MAFVNQRLNSRKVVSVGGVVLIHLAIGYAFVNGLAFQFIKHGYTVLTTYQVDTAKPPPPNPPKHDVKQERQVTIPEKTEVKVPLDNAGPVFQPKKTESIVQEPVKLTPPAPVYSRPLQIKGDRATWVTTDDYPASAIRNGEEGRVEIAVRVGANGRVTSCQVTKPSGHPSLDQATCYFYAKRARFLPALAADGTPVEAGHTDSVRWQLPE